VSHEDQDPGTAKHYVHRLVVLPSVSCAVLADTLCSSKIIRAMRQLEPHWNAGLVTASIAISLLGTFTSTQLVCQARLSRHTSAVLLWTLLASLTFGFCSIWCLHFVAMLAYELDLLIGFSTNLYEEIKEGKKMWVAVTQRDSRDVH